MSLLGNIIWLILGGFLAGLGYIIGGLALCITIIGIPLGLKAISFGFTVMTPFGKSVQPTEGGEGCLALVFNILWLVLFGWEIALVHITFGIAFGITVIGIPFAIQHFKLVPVALLPFSYKLTKDKNDF
ncbi:MAG: YccF domain-containing protein [Phototrophicales bacterium]|nr:MAG: YccF domain-containing protein [Phototrophicales bacterium]